MMFGQYSTFAFVDVETTGVSASGDRVLEIGILRVENGKVTDTLNTLLDPSTSIPLEITGITGISNDDILNAPHFSDIADQVIDILKGAVFVAHNARFDYAFLKHEFRRLGLTFNYKTLDTVGLSRTLFPKIKKHNLDSIIERLNIKLKNRHRAYDDASVLLEFMKFVDSNIPKNQLETVINNFLKTPTLPKQLKKTEIDSLPEGPGVYYMYDLLDTLLYVGKSVDTKSRVLSHFYNDFNSATDLLLAREVCRVGAVSTAGDLGASLKESQEIKLNNPIHNKRLKSKKGHFALMESITSGYLTTKLISIAKVNQKNYHQILGVFNSKKQLLNKVTEAAKEYKLCLKLLGIEKCKNACFGTQINLCNGACVAEEAPIKYNIRFIEAFSNQRVPKWPFKGAIGIHEKFEDIEEFHIFKDWCHLGTVTNDENFEEEISELLKNKVTFDWDNYKIIKRAVTKHAKSNTIVDLSNFAHSYPTEQL